MGSTPELRGSGVKLLPGINKPKNCGFNNFRPSPDTSVPGGGRGKFQVSKLTLQKLLFWSPDLRNSNSRHMVFHMSLSSTLTCEQIAWHGPPAILAQAIRTSLRFSFFF